jgi:predicted nucleic acid-binding protein
MEKPKVVFDCMVFLQAVISRKGIAFRLFEYLEENAFTLYISDPIIVNTSGIKILTLQMNQSKPFSKEC